MLADGKRDQWCKEGLFQWSDCSSKLIGMGKNWEMQGRRVEGVREEDFHKHWK